MRSNKAILLVLSFISLWQTMVFAGETCSKDPEKLRALMKQVNADSFLVCDKADLYASFLKPHLSLSPGDTAGTFQIEGGFTMGLWTTKPRVYQWRIRSQPLREWAAKDGRAAMSLGDKLRLPYVYFCVMESGKIGSYTTVYNPETRQKQSLGTACELK